MSRGKHLSLEEARKAGQIDQFCKEHPIEDAHPQGHERFKMLMDAAIKGSPIGAETSGPGSSEDCSDTQTPQGTSEDDGG